MFARIFLLSVLLIAGLAGPAASEGGKTLQWGEVSGWDIRVDRSLDNSCFAHRSFQDGTSLRIGMDAKFQTVYLVISNSKWDLLEEGRNYAVQFFFDDREQYRGSLVGIALGDEVALGNGNIGAALTKAFAESASLRLYYGGIERAYLALDDGRAALEHVAACQERMTAGGELKKAPKKKVPSY